MYKCLYQFIMWLCTVCVLWCVAVQVVLSLNQTYMRGSELTNQLLKFKEDRTNYFTKNKTNSRQDFSYTFTIEKYSYKFKFYNRKNADGVIISKKSSKEELRSLFNRNLDTKFVISGYLQFETITQIVDSYVHQQNVNIVLVDYRPLSESPLYLVAQSGVYTVGVAIAEMSKVLLEAGVTSWGQLHLIGHSLGAHIAGYAGLRLGGAPSRITGLDSTNVGFIGASAKFRLTKSDACFVDIIHTDGAKYGYYTPHGHADFYVNGGLKQLGCGQSTESANELLFCSHQRAVRYFNASIDQPYGFPAVRCKDLPSAAIGSCHHQTPAFMGSRTSPRSRGIFYVTANTVPPFVPEAATAKKKLSHNML